LKFLHYFRHTAATEIVSPALYLTPRSLAAPGNIFATFEGRTTSELRSFAAYFVAGEDWFILDAAGIDPANAPTVNLIEDFRYVDPDHALHACLTRPALRICVSRSLADAVRDKANGVKTPAIGAERCSLAHIARRPTAMRAV
jgi:hypothetical protein